MIQDIQRIEYRTGLLRKGMKRSSLPVQTWKGSRILAELRTAIIHQNVLNCGGVYGDRAAAEPAEYDHLRIVLTEDTVDIEVFNRRLLLASGDDRFRRVHRVLCKLNKACMTVPEAFTSEQRVGCRPPAAGAAGRHVHVSRPSQRDDIAGIPKRAYRGPARRAVLGVA
ncbi:MAG: hypothetical protein WBF17_21385 [Phycisphaerae bacterium]